MALPTVTVRPHSSSAYIVSSSTSWVAARDGTGTKVIHAADGAWGSNNLLGTYSTYQTFVWFDVASVLPADTIIVSADMKIKMDVNAWSGASAGVFLKYNWGSTVNLGNFRTAAEILALVGAPSQTTHQINLSNMSTSILKTMTATGNEVGLIDPIDGLRGMMAVIPENTTSTPPTSGGHWQSFYTDSGGVGNNMELIIEYMPAPKLELGANF